MTHPEPSGAIAPAVPIVSLESGASADAADPMVRDNRSDGSTQVRKSAPDALWALAVLLIIYVLSLYVRNIIPMLVPEMKETLHLSDFKLGLALGPVFSISYAVFSLPLGWAADRYSRRWILLLGTMLFGVATMTTGLAGGLVALLVSRLLVAVGEASLGPASGSLLAAKVPRERLATAISVYMTGTKLGSSLAYAVAGVGLTISASLIARWGVTELASWQMLMILSGVPVLVSGLLMLTVSEPQRPLSRVSEGQQTIFAFVKAERALLVPMIIAFSLMALCANSFVGWVPTYLTRHFHWTKSGFGPVLGLISVGAAVTLVIKGMIIDRLYQRGMKDVHIRFYSWLVLGTMPLAFALFFVSSAPLFLVLLSVVQVVSIPVTSYAATVVQVITPPALRGQMAAVSAVFLVAIGGLGPSVVAALTDFVFQDEKRVGLSLACVTIVVFPLVFFFLRRALDPLRARVLAVEAESAERPRAEA